MPHVIPGGSMAASLLRRLPRRARAAAALLLALVCQAAGAAPETFDVRLTPVPIDAATRSAVTGTGAATATLEGLKLALRGSFKGMRGAATLAELHAGTATGVRGPAIATVNVPAAADGTFAAELTLTPQQVDALHAGHVYLQIHSTSAPDGNLWGWLLH
jgi:hypothetical protein